MGVGPDEPLPDTAAPDPVSDGVAEALELSVGESEPVGLLEEDPVGVGLPVVGVGDDGDVAVGVTDGEPVPVGVAVEDGLPLVVGLGLLDGVADAQSGAVAE